MTDSTRMFPFSYARRVHFGDTDMAGVAHFSRLLCFVEEAEHAALESLGLRIIDRKTCWPRVRIEVDYLAPAHFGETLNILLRPARLGRASLTWQFRIQCPGRGRLAEGHITSCHAQPRKTGKFLPSPLPPALVSRMQELLRSPKSRPRPRPAKSI